MNKTEQSAKFLAEPDIHEEWESHYLNADLDRFYDAAFAKIVERLGAKPGERILDAGCGYCFHAARLARAGLDVTGVDLSPSALAQARQYLDRQGLTIDLRQGNLLSLPFENSAFRFVNCWGVLMHIPEVETALEELARVIEPGGRLALMENNRRSFHVRVWERAVRGAKRLLRRPLPRRDVRAQGIEEWRAEGLMIRKLDMNWVEEFMAVQGLRLVDRFPAQFTELYTNLPGKRLRRAVYGFNNWWFRGERSPALALGNVLIFEKSR